MPLIPVLCYHYFGVDRSIQPGIKNEDLAYITPVNEFERALDILIERGYSFGALTDSCEQSQKRCVITIDDGHSSVLHHAAPALEKRNIPATLFIVPTWVGREGYLGWNEINELTARGWQVGSHGLTHRLLTSLSDDDVVHELTESRKSIIDKLNIASQEREALVPVAFPMGGYSKRIERLARSVGYSYIATSRYGLWDGNTGQSIPRIVVKEPYDKADAMDDILNCWSRRGLELSARSLVKQTRDKNYRMETRKLSMRSKKTNTQTHRTDS